MSKKITKNLVCILIRGGLEIWIDIERVDDIKKAMEQKSVFRINGNIINAVDITGVFNAQAMEERNRRKNGEFQDSKGNWWPRFTRLCPRCEQYLPQGMTCGKCRF